MIVVLFSKGYYIQLNEMSMVLIVSAIVSIYWNSKDGKGSLIVSNSLSEK
jgi:hypothetical protein